jgi:nicotine blue oxidoreductase
VHVVLGAASEDVRGRAELPGCVLVDNPQWADGMGSSLCAGLESLATTEAAGALVMLVDQPGIGADAVARVLSAYTSPDTLAAASYNGKRGHPVLFGAHLWVEVAAHAVGDRGARAYLKAHEDGIALVECGDIAEAWDVDTEEDLPRLAQRRPDRP